MIKPLMTAVFGSRFDRERKRIQPIVDQIHAQEERLKDLSEADLKAQTARFRERLDERTGALKTELDQVRDAKHGCADPVERDRLEGRFHELERQYKKELAAGLDDILPEAFATVREACRQCARPERDPPGAQGRFGDSLDSPLVASTKYQLPSTACLGIANGARRDADRSLSRLIFGLNIGAALVRNRWKLGGAWCCDRGSVHDLRDRSDGRRQASYDTIAGIRAAAGNLFCARDHARDQVGHLRQ